MKLLSWLIDEENRSIHLGRTVGLVFGILLVLTLFFGSWGSLWSTMNHEDFAKFARDLMDTIDCEEGGYRYSYWKFPLEKGGILSFKLDKDGKSISFATKVSEKMRELYILVNNKPYLDSSEKELTLIYKLLCDKIYEERSDMVKSVESQTSMIKSLDRGLSFHLIANKLFEPLELTWTKNFIRVLFDI